MKNIITFFLIASSLSTTLLLGCDSENGVSANAHSTGQLNDVRNGYSQTYRTVTIGSQTWMAENLNYETLNSWCYENLQRNCNRYGRLYTWAAASTACPSGWHLPSVAEWEILIKNVGGIEDTAETVYYFKTYLFAGKKLKSKDEWQAYINDEYNRSLLPGEDQYGFTALPAGFYAKKGDEYPFLNMGHAARFWTSNGSGGYDNNPFHISLKFSWDEIRINGDTSSLSNGFSVRCVKV